ncbi:DoxX family membrane protein [Algoriphagus vanfongensis]|uniref:DoxX family membrane protein n=1 Tax=Algoriphagus vanfongensis TaxID=426371 RepID=UPI00040EB399|nr:DoxX family membrane protein [Algoriphagus vanfongensis]
MKLAISKEKLWDFFILSARFLIAWTFIRYGWSKLTHGQFGISEVELATQIKDLSLFRVSWYLFGHEPFNSIIGISEIICGVLLLFTRTSLIGAFLFLPIVTTILIIDLTVMDPGMAQAFAWRLGFYIVLDLLILWYHQEKIITIFNTLWYNVKMRSKIPIGYYLLIPIAAIFLEVFLFIPKLLVDLIVDPETTLTGLVYLKDSIFEYFNQL